VHTLTKVFIPIGCALGFLLVGCGAKTAPNPDGLELAQGDQIVIGTSADLAPLSYIEGDKIIGLEIDILQEIARRLKIEPEFVDTPYETLLQQLGSGRFDLASGAATATPERVEKYAATRPWLMVDEVVLVRKATPITGLNDLKGKSVAAQSGSDAARTAAKIPGVEVVYFPDLVSIVAATASGRVDAAYVDSVVAEHATGQNSDLRTAFVARPGLYPTVFFVRPDQPKLRKAINKALGDMIADGTYTRLYTETMKRAPRLDQLQKAPAA
jgi:polar amino acid transport system substrate-binding protein